MYTTLSYLPTLFLNQSFESYIQEHIFDPLNMSSTTFSVAHAKLGGHLAQGHIKHLRNAITGGQRPTKACDTIQPQTRRRKGPRWCGGYHLKRQRLSKLCTSPSVHDSFVKYYHRQSTWVAMLLNDGRHPFTNAPIIPPQVLDFVSSGLVVWDGKPTYPETVRPLPQPSQEN